MSSRALWDGRAVLEHVASRIETGYEIVLCKCPQPYLGACKAGAPECCETCGFMTPEQFDAIVNAVLAVQRRA